MFVLLILCCISAVSSLVNAEVTPEFSRWKLEYNKHYHGETEELNAFEKWSQNQIFIKSVNAANLTWTAKMNAFGDLTASEFANVMLMPSRTVPESANSVSKLSRNPSSLQTDSSFDWRERPGVVSKVKDQGSVGSCWAFSTVGNIEGQYALYNNLSTAVDLSPEYLVDCDGTHDTKHADCSVFGGWPYLAYQYVMSSGGIPSEVTWPYCAGTGACYPCMQGPVSLCGPPPYYCDNTIEKKCPSAAKTAKISDWSSVSTDETEIAEVLASTGPLSVLLDANQLQFYNSGVWDGHLPSMPAILGCSKTSLDHAVLLVGYGDEAVTSSEQSSSQRTVVPYWTVKNSWGTKWGEEGYFRIVRGTGACGINTAVTTAIIV